VVIRRTLRWSLAALAAVVVVVAVVGPWLAPHDPDTVITAPYTSARAGLVLGSDRLGRDVWSRVLAGGRAVVIVPLLATAVTVGLGTAMGVTAAYRRGALDAILSRTADLVVMIPPVLALLVLLNAWGYSTSTLLVSVAIVGVPFVARIARAATLQILESPYVEQAEALGERPHAVMIRELLPNLAGPVLADAGLRVVGAVYIVAAAAFLGFGSGRPDWGAMVYENAEGAALTPWGMVAPAVLLAVLALSLNLGLDRIARWADR
jgi:peptide/nickel transport system permease protein